jgi:hypothetical protein
MDDSRWLNELLGLRGEGGHLQKKLKFLYLQTGPPRSLRQKKIPNRPFNWI